MTDDPIHDLLLDATRTLRVAPPDTADLGRRIEHARRRRTRRRAVAASMVVGTAAAVTALVATSGARADHRINVVTPPPPTASVPTTGASTVPVPTTPASTLPTATSLPVSVESDADMAAAGNEGPSSSILAPASCSRQGDTVTASGGYTNGGFAPNVYDRYGDVVELYVYDVGGSELAVTGSEQRPAIGGYGSWAVSAPLDPAATSRPARCVVVAQPTHALVLAPSTNLVSCGADDQPQRGYNLDYIDQSGTTCQTARSVSLTSVNNPSISFGSAYNADGFACTAQSGPASGQLYYIYTCVRGAAEIVFKSRTP